MKPTLAAPVWRRLAALVYDTLIMIAISFFYGAVVTAVFAQGQTTTETYHPMFESPFFLVGWITCLLCFYGWFWHKSGQTLGMRTWRLKLVQKQDHEQTPNWAQCFSRAIVAPSCNLLFGIGFWYQWFNEDGDCLPDKLTNTRVIITTKGK